MDKCQKRGSGRDGWKSEAPIVAVKPGNAGGAKGCRVEITEKGHTALHREDSDRDHKA